MRRFHGSVARWWLVAVSVGCSAAPSPARSASVDALATASDTALAEDADAVVGGVDAPDVVDVSDRSVPDTSAPDTSAPDTSAPDTSAPDTTAADATDATPGPEDGGAAPDAADAGPTDVGPPCKSDLSAVDQTPGDSQKVDFEGCTGCACCTAAGKYPSAIPLACLQCGPASSLAAVGGTLQGGMLTTMVSCIQGNAAAPFSGNALFVGGGLTGPTGKPALIIDFVPPVTIFGFSGLATSSNAQPHVVLRGYDSTGALIADDAFDFTGKPGGVCATTNPAVQFFGFRPCGGTAMSRVILETSDANVAIDNVRVWRP